MVILGHRFVQKPYAHSDEYRKVCDVADALLTHLNEPDAQTLLAAANAPGQSSLLVQQSFAAFAVELGFRDESKGLFNEYANKALRPDYYLPVADTGILLEVERGKTTIN